MSLIGGAMVLLCVVLAIVFSGGPYDRRGASSQSAEVQAALEILQGIAADPAAVGAAMSEGAGEQARRRVMAAARQMSSAATVELEEASWWGSYLRVRVACRSPDARTIEKAFFLTKTSDGLRITGTAE